MRDDDDRLIQIPDAASAAPVDSAVATAAPSAPPATYTGTPIGPPSAVNPGAPSPGGGIGASPGQGAGLGGAFTFALLKRAGVIAVRSRLGVQISDRLSSFVGGTQPVPPSPDIDQSTFTAAREGVAYDVTMTATGGKLPLTWSATGLPDGLSLNTSTGKITGTPTNDTDASVNLTVTDALNRSSLLAGGLAVYAPVPTIDNSTLDEATIDEAYTDDVEVSDGEGAKTWSIVSGALPDGLSLNSSTGEISGTPTGDADDYDFTVRVTDAQGAFVEQAYTLTLASGSLFQIDFSAEPDTDPFDPADYDCTQDRLVGGAGAIASGRLQSHGSNGTQSFHADIDALDLDGVANFAVELGDYVTAETATANGGALALLADVYNPGAWGTANAYGSMDGYYLEIGAFSGHMRVLVWRVVNGSATFLAQWNPGAGYPNSAGTNLRAEVTIQAGQTDIVVKANGTTVLTINDTHAARIQNFRTVGVALAYANGATSIESVTVE